ANALQRLADDNVGRGQALAFRMVSPFARGYLIKGLGLTEPRFQRALDKIRKEFDLAAERLQRTPYLAGDRFSAADLTFATMAAPVVCVQPEEGYHAVLPRIEALDEPSRALVTEMRDHPAGQFALRMFREERDAPTPHPP
ncbi:MAG: glutathione S-transferase C-terminal domain-containing protein, partial [Myxococcota bacterium]